MEAGQKLEGMCRSKFAENPLVNPGLMFFPHRCLSAACAQWGFEAVCQLVDEFHDSMGLAARYKRFARNITGGGQST